MAIKLNQSSLESLPANVGVPAYDRDDIQAGIIHIGVGNFHRAHQAVYLDQLFNLGQDHDWGLIGAGIKSYDATMRKKLEAQDWLTTVVELDAKGLTAKVCGSMIDFIDIDPESLTAALARPQIRIVSLTITEGGYFIDEKTGGLQLGHPEIQHDIDHPDAPQTVFGLLIAGLKKRRAAGLPPYTIVSCDNAPHNGRLTQNAVVGLARAIEPELADWIESHVAFPNSMVDCIVPATSDRERAKLVELFGIEDAAPVFCEPYRQWVLEDNFPQGRPALEKVGVEFVDDVAPYELMKLRVLNGSHAAIAYPAALLGFDFVHDAMAEPVIRAYLEKLVVEEVIPTLEAVPGVDFHEYFTLIAHRFSNPELADTIPRLCFDGSNRMPKFILPIITANIASGHTSPGLAMVIALWCRFCAAAAEDGSKIDLVDEHGDRLKEYALKAKENPSVFLEMEDIFGALGSNPDFVKQFSLALKSLWQFGTRNALEKYSN